MYIQHSVYLNDNCNLFAADDYQGSSNLIRSLKDKGNLSQIAISN